MKRLVIFLCLISIILFSLFFIPQRVEVEGEPIGYKFKPIYWNPNSEYEPEKREMWTAEDFENLIDYSEIYDWYEPRDTTNHYILISSIDFPRYFVCLFIITAVFASFYALIPKKEESHG